MARLKIVSFMQNIGNYHHNTNNQRKKNFAYLDSSLIFIAAEIA